MKTLTTMKIDYLKHKFRNATGPEVCLLLLPNSNIRLI